MDYQNNNNQSNYNNYGGQQVPQQMSTQPIQPVAQQMSTQPIQPVAQQQNIGTINEELLISAYIGKNEEKLQKGFSVCCLLLGKLYVLYRKMWLFAIIWYAISIVITIALKGNWLINLAINVIAAFIFKGSYQNTVKKRVEKIKMKNEGKSKEELIAICSKKGGTTIVLPLIIALIPIILTCVITYKSVMTAKKDTETLIFSTPIEKNGQVTMRDISFTITPEMADYGFPATDLYNILMFGDTYDCTIKAEKCRDCSTINECIEKNNISNPISETDVVIKKIKNNKWHTKTVTADKYKREFSYLEVKDGVYSISLTVKQDDQQKTCETSYENLLKTVKIK